MTKTQPVTWTDVMFGVGRIARAANPNTTSVYGVPTGGAPVAVAVANTLSVPLVETPIEGTLVVDDLVDSGATLTPYRNCGYATDAIYRKPHSPDHLAPSSLLVDSWLTFPWERDQGDPTDAVTRLLQYLGEDPTRDGLRDTPRRVVKALTELTRGYGEDPGDILARTFDVQHDQMIHVHGITVRSLCEHHMLPFTGTAHVAYIPGDRVVGLSKIPRVVHTFARRLQVQERLTEQVGQALWDHLNPVGVGVEITAHHSCMGLRGVEEADATMTTTALYGAFRKPEVRAEFLR